MSPADRAPVVVVGGGLAGLCAAAHLARRVPTTILEAEPDLGGQCATMPSGGERFDRGVHGIYPRYVELRRLLALTGVAERSLPAADGQVVITPDGRVSPVRMPPLPAPAHCAAHVVRLGAVGVADRARLAVGSARLIGVSPDRDGLDDITLVELASRARIPGAAFRIVYEPLAWIGFFLSPHELSAAAYLSALRFLIVGRSDSWRARWVPPPNRRTLVAPLLAELEAHGAAVHTSMRVRRLRFDGGSAVGVEATDRRGGSRSFDASAVVCAVPPLAAAAVLDGAPAASGLPDRLRRLGTTAVTTHHFTYSAGAPLRAKNGVVLTHDSGFVFFSLGEVFDPPRWPAVRRIEVQCGPDIADAGATVLERWVRTLLPDPGTADLLRVDRVATVPYARFGVGSGRDRPPVTTPWRNVFLAGDWVAEPGGSWFMERATRTGTMAAESVLGGRTSTPGRVDGPGFRLARLLAPRIRLERR
jgi:carotenoid phi-ring synthase / carotenoid chi-ring synthase